LLVNPTALIAILALIFVLFVEIAILAPRLEVIPEVVEAFDVRPFAVFVAQQRNILFLAPSRVEFDAGAERTEEILVDLALRWKIVIEQWIDGVVGATLQRNA
jgi:hypothetical protein